MNLVLLSIGIALIIGIYFMLSTSSGHTFFNYTGQRMTKSRCKQVKADIDYACCQTEKKCDDDGNPKSGACSNDDCKRSINILKEHCGDSWTKKVADSTLWESAYKECCVGDHKCAQLKNPHADLHYVSYTCNNGECKKDTTSNPFGYDLHRCQQNCKKTPPPPPPTQNTYSCKNGQCEKDSQPNPHGDNLHRCQQNCKKTPPPPPPPQKYSCVPGKGCQLDANGWYTNKNCNNACIKDLKDATGCSVAGKEINKVCCAHHNCAGGAPAKCSQKCADKYIGYYDSCKPLLTKTRPKQIKLFDQVRAKCSLLQDDSEHFKVNANNTGIQDNQNICSNKELCYSSF